jgi:hypothetical protein
VSSSSLLRARARVSAAREQSKAQEQGKAAPQQPAHASQDPKEAQRGLRNAGIVSANDCNSMSASGSDVRGNVGGVASGELHAELSSGQKADEHSSRQNSAVSSVPTADHDALCSSLTRGRHGDSNVWESGNGILQGEEVMVRELWKRAQRQWSRSVFSVSSDWGGSVDLDRLLLRATNYSDKRPINALIKTALILVITL